MFFNEEHIILEGLNDRFDGIHHINKNISSDIYVDSILGRTPVEKIWFGTDWHLYKYDKEKKEIYRNPDFNKIISNQNKLVGDNDIFIFLGDLIDDECQNYDKLAEELYGKLKGYKIFILGNNDLQPESYYTDKLGFDAVFQAYQWGKFTFSHEPLPKYDTTYNIHGHMHQWWDYNYQGVVWNNMIKLYTKDFNNKPINLREVVDLWNKGYFIENINKN